MARQTLVRKLALGNVDALMAHAPVSRPTSTIERLKDLPASA
ncbi:MULTISPECIES: hypothetical protein [unclassified Mesorhizobium]